MADPAEETDEQTPDEDSPRGLRRKIEEANQRARDAEAKAAKTEELERKLALHEAGLGNLSERQQKALFATHDGESSADALQATAKELFGDGASAQSTTTPEEPAPSDPGVAQFDTFGRGGGSMEPPPPAKAELQKGVEERITRGASPDEVLRYIFEDNKHLLDS